MIRLIAHAAGIGSLVLVLTLSPIALADRGGNGNGNGKPEASDAWVSVSPSPVLAGSRPGSLEGCGYDVEPVQVRVVEHDRRNRDVRRRCLQHRLFQWLGHCG